MANYRNSKTYKHNYNDMMMIIIIIITVITI
jgi:hypothetical protein